MSSVLVALRRLRDDRVAAFGVALVVLVTATTFAVAPRLLERVGDAALQDTVRGAAAFDKTIAVVEEETLPPGSDGSPLGGVDQEGDRLAQRFPASVKGLIAGRSTVVDSMRFRLEADTPDPTFVRFRIQPGADSRIHWVAGRPPTATTSTVDLPPGPPAAGEQPQTTATVVEVGIAEAATRPIGNGLGDTIILTPDSRDVLVAAGQSEGFAAMKIVGLFAVDDPADPFWTDDHALEHVTYRSLGGDSLFVDVTALTAPETYPALGTLLPAAPMTMRTTWRWALDPTTLHASDLDGLSRDLRRLDTTFPKVGPATRALTEPALQSGLLPLIDGHRTHWNAALAILLVLAIGPATIALATLLLIASIASRRRRSALALVRGRGATLGQATRAIVLEGAVLAVPATAIAIAIAALAVPSVALGIRPTILAAAAVAVVAILFLVLSGLGGLSAAAAGRPPSDADVPGRRSARRLVLDAVVIVLAATGAFLLRERGVQGASSSQALTGADPLIAAVPALAGLAVGLAAVRIVPLPLRLLSRVSAAGRGLVAMLAFRRASGGGTTGPLLVVLMVVAAIGAFASATLVHLERSGVASSWDAVGAPYRVLSNAGALPQALDPTALPGVRSAARDFQALVAFGPSRLRVQLNGIDAATYQAMAGGSAADPGLPPEMLGPAPKALPVIVSNAILSRPDGVKLGAEFEIQVDGFPIPIRVAGGRDGFPGIPTAPFLPVLISRTQMLEIQPNLHLAPSILFLDAPPGNADGIREAVLQATPVAQVDDRASLEAAFERSPVTAAILRGVIASSAIAAAYAALAVTASLAIAGASRAGETAKLRTLGLSRRQAVAMTVIEHGPTVLIAFVVGVAFGLGLFALLEPGLGVDALVNARLPVPLTADPAQLAMIFGIVVAIAAVGIGLAAWLQRRGSTVLALRRGTD
jgi:putative ABC transport system permease protein